ncbi:hypothetical protein [Bdellovibrio sp. HCB337]|uniref:hypothetical protein n=1 Tax=Bdellovibrio sp. HCB337 TaxID=3394358 RepID=UPI0039A47487
MKTYPIKTDTGLIGFEIENSYVSPRYIEKYLKDKNGISNIRRKNLEHSDNRLEFEYLGDTYVVFEPYGDNSRYWIGPKKPEMPLPQTPELESLFAKLKEPIYMKLLWLAFILLIAFKLANLVYSKMFA